MAQEKVTYTHGSLVNHYIVYSLPDNFAQSGRDLMKHCLFGATSYNKKKWSGYGVAFGILPYSHTNSGKSAKKLVILGADLSNSSNEETKKNNVLVLGKVSIEVSNTTTIQAKDELKTDSTIPNKKFILSVHYNGDDRYFFVNNIQQYKFKAVNSEIKANKLCLSGFSEDPSFAFFYSYR